METKKSLTREDHDRAHTQDDRAGTAADVKDMRERLDLTSDVLQQIPILAEGTKLHQGSTYIDLRGDAAKPFTATSDQQVEPGQVIAWKRDVPYEIWDHLVGGEKPGRGFRGAPSYDKHG